MGRIKSALIKRTAKWMLKEENSFKTKFEDNKKVLGGKSMPSKSLRNKIAGYLAKLNIMEKAKRERLQTISPEA